MNPPNEYKVSGRRDIAVPFSYVSNKPTLPNSCQLCALHQLITLLKERKLSILWRFENTTPTQPLDREVRWNLASAPEKKQKRVCKSIKYFVSCVWQHCYSEELPFTLQQNQLSPVNIQSHLSQIDCVRNNKSRTRRNQTMTIASLFEILRGNPCLTAWLYL